MHMEMFHKHLMMIMITPLIGQFFLMMLQGLKLY